jgi:hypothetical protein
MRLRGATALVVSLALVGACGGGGGKPASAGSKDAASARGAASAADGGASERSNGPSAATEPKAETPPSPLARLLLSATDLGDGWRTRGYTTLDPATASLLRLCGRNVAIGASSVVALSQAKEGNVVVHLVARFDSSERAKQAVQAVAQAGLSCGQWSFEGAHVKINPVDYPRAGDGRFAFRMVVDGTKHSNADYFVWYRGRYVAAILNAASVLLDPEITKRAIAAADRLLVKKG